MADITEAGVFEYMYFISTDSILSIVCEVGDILNESDEQRAVTLWASG